MLKRKLKIKNDKLEIASKLLPFIPIKQRTLEEMTKMNKRYLEFLVDKLTKRFSNPIDKKHEKIKTSANMLWYVFKAWKNQYPNMKIQDLPNRKVVVTLSGNVVCGCFSHARWLYDLISGEDK